MTLHEVNDKPKRDTVEKFQLPSVKGITSEGVGFSVTSCPHRNGNPDHQFYEAWFNWEGGTLRSSTVIHDPGTRRCVLEFLGNITGIDHTEIIDETLDKYDWHTGE